MATFIWFFLILRSGRIASVTCAEHLFQGNQKAAGCEFLAAEAGRWAGYAAFGLPCKGFLRYFSTTHSRFAWRLAMQSFPEISLLKQLVAEDTFVRIPMHHDIPYQQWGRVLHARHLIRFVGRAVRLLENGADHRFAARNEDAMSRQRNTPLAVRIQHAEKGRVIREDLLDCREDAEFMLNIVAMAVIID